MLQIFNSRTLKKEVFTPIIKNKISLYVCGVTVYDYCHLGHARTYSAIDFIINYLKWRGFDVLHVRNITDIDDKIIQRANEKNISFDEITGQFTQEMHKDFAALGLFVPDKEPRATEYISKMIALIKEMLAKDFAYIAANGDVYFEVRKFSEYGCLSHQKIDQLESGARVDVSEVKRDALDFVLWKIAKPNEPAWDSPWGQGRPGWHTECVAMSTDLLGETFDLHAGGKDLIFPHHENEFAQAGALQPNAFANVWMHTGHLQLAHEKMSKSLGNFVTIRDVLAKHSAEVIRYFFLSSHYRSQLSYSEDQLLQVKQSLSRLYNSMRGLTIPVAPLANSSYENEFILAMDDDFNTPEALSCLFKLAHEIQKLKSVDIKNAAAHAGLLKKLGGVLGILQQDVEVFFQASVDVDGEKIAELIAARTTARANKDWVSADKIRQELDALKVVIDDTAEGTTWRIKE